MSLPRQSKPLLALFLRLYIMLGTVSTAAGIYLIRTPQLRVVGTILLVFGIVRVVNALVQLHRMRRS